MGFAAAAAGWEIPMKWPDKMLDHHGGRGQVGVVKGCEFDYDRCWQSFDSRVELSRGVSRTDRRGWWLGGWEQSAGKMNQYCMFNCKWVMHTEIVVRNF